MARLRKHVDPGKLERAHECWRAGEMSLNSAAKYVGCDRDALRFRWPEFAQWAERKRIKVKIGPANRP